jgi:BirA family transcriptional regulator, biotin operon repressor / biotin---[acetyl-CoA-carboxylase] ligase
VSPADGLRNLLAARAWPWPAPIEHHRSLDSTNDRLKELARAGAPEGSVVWADAQIGGHGRHGRAWVSPPGNLYVSVLLRPEAAPAALLPLAAGVAVAEAIESLGVAARLKWPNDVMVGDRKLGGILAESSSTGPSIDWVVLGIGVNVKAPLAPELALTATSLLDAGGSLARVEDVACAVLARLGVWYHRLSGPGASGVLDEWRRRSVSWWGQPVEAWLGGLRVAGCAVGVDDEGGLVLERDDGSRATLRSGEVRRCRPVSS